MQVRRETSLAAAVQDALGIQRLDVIPTGGDEIQRAREQWDSGSNFVAVQPFGRRARFRLAGGLFLNVAGIAGVTLLVGEPLLELLGLTTAALSATGGIALMIAAVPLMLGGTDATASTAPPMPSPQWRSVVFMPLTFPLTIGGATIGVLIGFRANAHGARAVTFLLATALLYALVTAVCVLAAGALARRISEPARHVLDRVAGILLVAIASMLLAGGFTRLVLDVIDSLHRPAGG